MDSKLDHVYLSLPQQTIDTQSNAESTLTTEGVDDYLLMIYDCCRTEDGKVSVKLFLEEIQRSGLRISDPRLSNVMQRLESLTIPSQTVEQLKLDPNTFKTILSESIVIVLKAFQNQFILHDYEGFCEEIKEIYEKCKNNVDGKTASYIPQLSSFGPEKWGVAICTVDGQRFSIGDASDPFTLQSSSQAITYGICLNELGEKVVHKYEGREPSGSSFNEIALDYQNKPHNPLVNSGAIMSSALILKLVRPELGEMAEKYEFIYDCFKRMAGGEYLGFNNSVFLSERQNTFRNFALAYFMSENKCFPSGVDLKKTVDLYLQICSLEMNCESNSVIASTLANGGVCPLTGERVLCPEAVQDLLALMYSCGLSNSSGQFAFEVGLPAKSGVSGVVMVVIPNVMGITLWSPLVDFSGNSVRALQFCRELVKSYSFHRFAGIGGKISEKTRIFMRNRDTTNEAVVQILLAASIGDQLFLQRAWLRDIDLNIADYDGRTPLHLAAAEGQFDCVHFLLYTVNVYPNPRDRWKHTPLEEAEMFGHVDVVNVLRKYMDDNPHILLESRDDDFNDEDFPGFPDIKEHEVLDDILYPCSRQTSVSESLDSKSDHVKQISVPTISIDEATMKDENFSQTYLDVTQGKGRTQRSNTISVMPPKKINIRSPRPTPHGSPTLPRARFLSIS